METTINNLINAIGWGIIHSIWQGAIIYLAIMMIQLSLKNLSSRSKYNLLFGAINLLFISFIATVLYFYKSNSATNPSDLNLTNQEIINILSQIKNNKSLDSYIPYISGVYIIGIIVQLIILSNCFTKLRTIKYKGLHGAPKEWLEKFEGSVKKLKISKKTNFYLSDLISVPLTLGYLKPIVLFPVAYANKMQMDQVEAILLHELAHIKRNDYLLNLIKIVIEMFMFFNPFVWAISRSLERERENACDDIVIQQAAAITYAHALVELETLRNKVNSPLTLAVGKSKEELFKRIKRITRMESKKYNVKQYLMAIMLCTISLVFVAWIIPSEKKRQNNEVSIEDCLKNPEDCELEIFTDTIIPNSPQEINTIKIVDPIEPKTINTVVNLSDYKDTIKLPLKIQMQEKEIQKHAEKIQKSFESKEWKDKIAKIEKNAIAMAKKFESPEWQNHIKKIEAEAKKNTQYFESKEWKDKVTEIEKNAVAITKKFESPEWQNHIKKIEAEAKKNTIYFESKEWKEKVAKMEKNAEKMAQKFESKEWKEKMADMERKADNMIKRMEAQESEKRKNTIKKENNGQPFFHKNSEREINNKKSEKDSEKAFNNIEGTGYQQSYSYVVNNSPSVARVIINHNPKENITIIKTNSSEKVNIYRY